MIKNLLNKIKLFIFNIFKKLISSIINILLFFFYDFPKDLILEFLDSPYLNEQKIVALVMIIAYVIFFGAVLYYIIFIKFF